MVMAVFILSPMHEEMQKRTGKEQQKGTDPEEMSPVLAEEKKGRNREKRQQHPSRA
jgi:hypothetical protein